LKSKVNSRVSGHRHIPSLPASVSFGSEKIRDPQALLRIRHRESLAARSYPRQHQISPQTPQTPSRYLTNPKSTSYLCFFCFKLHNISASAPQRFLTHEVMEQRGPRIPEYKLDIFTDPASAKDIVKGKLWNMICLNPRAKYLVLNLYRHIAYHLLSPILPSDHSNVPRCPRPHTSRNRG
jgi:hypothetical protein